MFIAPTVRTVSALRRSATRKSPAPWTERPLRPMAWAINILPLRGEEAGKQRFRQSFVVLSFEITD